jgi:ferredoxin
MRDLLRIRILDVLTSSRFYPLAARIFTLACFVVLIAGGLAVPHVSEKLAGTLRNTNLAALIVWSIWWPLMIISAVLLGRAWCQVCPMELVASLAGKLGLRRKPPVFLTSGWGVTVLYSLALLVFIRTFWAHRFPERMAFFFLFLLGAALVTGLIYEKRTFCSYLCPVGRLLGLYACCSGFEWRVRDRQVCEACRSKDCVAAKSAYRLTARSCSSNLYVANLTDNRDCLVCTDCRKVCPNNNLRFSPRRFFADFFGPLRLDTPEFFLLLLAGGLVVWEISEEWSAAKAAMLYVPDRITALVGASGEGAHLIHALVLFVALPVVLFLIPGIIGKWVNRISLMDSLKTFGLMFLPVVALTHMLKAVFRFVSRLPYYPLALKDPVGLETARALSEGTLVLDKRLPEALDPVLSALALVVFAAGLAAAWAIGMRSPQFKSLRRGGQVPYLTVVTLYAAVFITSTIFARF